MGSRRFSRLLDLSSWFPPSPCCADPVGAAIRERVKSRRRTTLESIESLESRILLSVSPTLSDATVTFDVSAESGLIEDIPDVHLRTNDSGELEWSRTGVGGSWSNDLNANRGGRQTLVLADQEAVSIVLRVDGLTEVDDVFTHLFENPISGFFLHDLYTGGVDLNVRSTKIRVTSGATVSTRDIDASSVDPQLSAAESQLLGRSEDNSGSLKLNAPKIVLASDSAIVAHSDSGYDPGDVSMKAIGTLDAVTSSLVTLPLLPNVTITSATIEMTDSTVMGGDISIDAVSDSADLFDDNGEAGNNDASASEQIAEWLGGLSLIGGAAISEATSKVIVSGGSIDAAGDLTLNSEALTDAQVKTISLFLAASYAHAIPTARINIKDGAALTAVGDVIIDSEADATLSSAASQNLFGVSSFVEETNVTLAAGYSDATAETRLAPDATIDAGGAVEMRASSGSKCGRFFHGFRVGRR